MTSLIENEPHCERVVATHQLINICQSYESYKYVERVKSLISKGADINCLNGFGWTPLMEASGGCETFELAETLVQLGANVNYVNANGYNALSIACANNNPNIVEMLLNSGAVLGIDQGDTGGDTPLIVAAGDGSVTIVKMLLSYGAEIDRADISGNTALMEAAFFGEYHVVELLMSKGANVNHANIFGDTAIMKAIKEEHFNVANLLRYYHLHKVFPFEIVDVFVDRVT